MPPEPSPWDRKDFFKERKHDRSSDSNGFVSRWRETPRHGLSSSSRDFGRWGSAESRNRPSGHGKQGGWHLYPEEYGRSFPPSRLNEKILDDDGCRPSGSCADGKYSRNGRENGRENKGSSSQKDWKGHSWENGASTNSQPHSEFVNTWDQLHSKNQHDKTGFVNGERENSLGSIDWKPFKWNRSGSLSSRGSGFSHSSSSKSLGVDSGELKAEPQVRVVTPVQSPPEEAVTCATMAAPAEEASSRKKPRLGWGEGLAKYEKKKVDGPDDSGTKRGIIKEPMHPHGNKSPRVVGFSDCTSPATPSSVACSSSPGVEDKPFIKAANMDNNNINLSSSLNLPSPNQLEGTAFNLENLELTQITNLSSSLSELLQYDDPGSVDSSFARSTGMNKLLVWKVNILRALEMTESEIDSLEIELKSLISESRNSHPCAAASSSLHGECQAKPCEELVASSNLIPRPAPLLLVSSGDMILEKVVGNLEEEHTQARDEDVDSPGTVTSKFVELISSAKGVSLSEPVNHDECAGDPNASKSKNVEMNCSVYDSDEEKTGGLSASKCGDKLKESNSCAALCVSMRINYDREGILCDLILASNKDSASRASDVFNNLLPSNQCYGDISRANSTSSWRSDPLIKEKFAMRKRFLKFKERVIALKFRAFQHLWKEDMRLLSIRKVRAKSQKRLELILRSPQGTYQKHRSSIRSRFTSTAGNSSLVPTTEIISFTGKLLSDSQVKLYRNSLKMPAMILDKKEKIISRFISGNGLVEDPCAVEKERAVINPWTSEEKEIFMDKLATLGKDFTKIASFLDHKTTADCIEFYYKNHKSDCFIKTKKPEVAGQGKSCFTNNYLVTAGKRWNRQINAVSLDMLGAASAIAANANDNCIENQQKCKARFILGVTGDYRAPRGDDVCIVEKSNSLDFLDNERETVAADVLAGICGSLSSEAMSSCITSSFDRGESFQKVGSLTRQPLTPEVTQTIDDDTCSDESSEEMMDPTDWTDEEKSIFIRAVSSFGKDFAMISRCVRTRSRDQCKVFFSKSRKCLGLDDMIGPGPCNEEKLLSDDANGGGSDNEDAACVLETGSVMCSERSGSKMDEDMILSDLNMNHCEKDDPAETVNLQTDLNCSEEDDGTGQIERKDPELLPEYLITDVDLQAECKLELDLGKESKVENVDYKNVEGTSEGTSLGESVSAEDTGDQGLSISSAEGETVAVDQDSIDHCITEPEGQELASENLSEKQEKNREDGNASGTTDFNCSDQGFRASGNASDLAGDSNNAPVKFGVNPKQDPKIISLDLNPPEEPLSVSLEQDVSIVNANSVKTPEQDLPSTLDIGKTSDKQCEKPSSVDDYDQHRSGHSMLGYVESCQILRGYPLLMLTNKEMDGDISSEKLASSVQSLSKVDRNFHSDMSLLQESFLQKCSNSKPQNSVSELPFLSQEQKSNHHSRPHSWSSSDTGKPRKNGDVKLFGQILTHPSSQPKQITSDTHGNEDSGVLRHPKLSSKNLNQKLTSTNVDTSSNPSKFDRNSYLGLENVPIRSYGFWDGNRIQTGFSTLPESAILLAKYPAAFGNYSTSSSNTGQQQPLHSVVKSNERNLNGISVLTARDVSSSHGGGNGVEEYQLFRNREGGARVPPFTVDVKQQQRQEILFSEMHRRNNGFEPVSSIQPQVSRGMVGINVVGRGGILVGGACTAAGVSDPVAAIKMHYAKTEQCNGQTTASVIREEESWRGKGDVGR